LAFENVSNEIFKATTEKSSSSNLCPTNIENFTIINFKKEGTNNKSNNKINLKSSNKQKTHSDHCIISSNMLLDDAIDFKYIKTRLLSPQKSIMNSNASNLTQKNYSNINKFSDKNQKSNLQNTILRRSKRVCYSSSVAATISIDINNNTSSKFKIIEIKNTDEKSEKESTENAAAEENNNNNNYEHQKKVNLAKLLNEFKRKTSYSDKNITNFNKVFNNINEELENNTGTNSHILYLSKQPDKKTENNISLLFNISAIQEEKNHTYNAAYVENCSDKEIHSNTNKIKINKQSPIDSINKSFSNKLKYDQNEEQDLEQELEQEDYSLDQYNYKDQKQFRIIKDKDLKLNDDVSCNNNKDNKNRIHVVKTNLNLINRFSKTKSLISDNNNNNKDNSNVKYAAVNKYSNMPLPVNENFGIQINPFATTKYEQTTSNINTNNKQQISKNTSSIYKSKNNNNTELINDNTLNLSPIINKKRNSDLNYLDPRSKNGGYDISNYPSTNSHLTTTKKDFGLFKNKPKSNKIIMKNVKNTTNFCLSQEEKENCGKLKESDNKKLILKKTTDSTPENIKKILIKKINKENISIKLINVTLNYFIHIFFRLFFYLI